jgi:hypothetical protein
MKPVNFVGKPLPGRRRRHHGSKGFLMPTTLVIVFTMLAGLSLELSSAAYKLKASISTSASRKAEEAANFGLNAFIDSLNSDQNSYLLATKLVNEANTGNWQTVTAADLASCSLLQPATAPSANRIPGVATNTVKPSEPLPGYPAATYSLVGFEPADAGLAGSSGCSMFGNLAGGQARITVRGIVSNAGVELARYDLVRLVNVQASTANPNPNQLGLVITGDGSWSQLGGPSFLLYDANADGLADYTGIDPGADVNCLDCKTSPGRSSATLGSVLYGTPAGMPSFPTMPAELVGVTERDLTKSSGTNYPYTTASTAPGSPLESECRWLTVNGVADAEIGCRIGEVSIGGGKTVTVRADLRPVRLFLSGDFTTSGSGALSVTDGDAATADSADVKAYWKNLRIYGRSGTPTDEKDCNQSITMSGSSAPYGFAMWFPLGDVTISGGGKKAQPDFFGTLWTCKVDKISGNSTILVPSDAVSALAPNLKGSFSYRVKGVQR